MKKALLVMVLALGAGGCGVTSQAILDAVDSGLELGSKVIYVGSKVYDIAKGPVKDIEAVVSEAFPASDEPVR